VICSLFVARPSSGTSDAWRVERFPPSQELVLGEITSVRDARSHARLAWAELLERGPAGLPLAVWYSEENDTWTVSEVLPPGFMGWVAGVILQGSDGRVLAVWFE